MPHLLLLLAIIAPSLQVNVSVPFEWTHVNFTWPSKLHYDRAVYYHTYIPVNNVPTCIKIYNDTFYVALGRFHFGTPVTLATFRQSNETNPLLKPFPSWEYNVRPKCHTIQNVNSIEIDKNGVMWILDGVRSNNLTACAAKLILYDLNSHKVILTYIFPGILAGSSFMRDFVLDEDFVYISDGSIVDPGLIIYSRSLNHAWKVRDASMYSDADAKFPMGMSGIALSPAGSKHPKNVYYSPMGQNSFYSVSTAVLKDPDLCETTAWRKHIRLIGKKVKPSVTLGMDSMGNLYFDLLDRNAMAKWDINQPFSSSKVVYEDKKMLDWISCFAFNSSLYVLTNGYSTYLNENVAPKNDSKVKFRILKMYSNNYKSYLYN